MYSAQVVQLYERGQRGRPITFIGAGDLRDPYGKSPWQRVKSAWAAFTDAMREARELEASLIGKGHYREFRQD